MTSWQFTPYLLLILLAAVTTAGLSLFIWRRRRAHAASALLALTLTACLWSVTYLLEIAAVSLEAKLLWIRIEYIAIALLPVTWLIFAMRFAMKDAWLTTRFKLALLIIPLLTVILIWIGPAHGLYYQSVGLRTINGITYFTPEYGPWFWIHTLYSYTLYIAGAVVLFRRMQKSTDVYRQQSELILLGSIPPFVTSFIFVFSPTTLDPAPIAFTISSLFFAWGLFRTRLFERETGEDVVASAEAQAGLSIALHDSRVRILNVLLWGFSFLTMVQLVPIVIDELQKSNPDPATIVIAIGFSLLFVFLAAAQRISYSLRGGLLLAVLFLFAFNNLRQVGMDIDVGMTLFAFVIFAYILFGRLTGMMAMILSLVTIALGGWQILSGELVVEPVYVEGAPWNILLVPLISFALFAGSVLLAQASLLTDLQKLLTRSKELSNELEQERRLLEQRVDERTRALSISSAISSKLSSILEPGVLVDEVVNQLQTAFNYYHSHVYLLDEADNKLFMVGGSGLTGRQLTASAHSMKVGEGLVGRAAATGTPILARDVTQELGFRPNPLLPDTRSELSVPIRFGDQVLGVLDVQQDVVDGFGPQDLDVLQSVANQLAVALRNTRLYSEARRRAEREMLANQISQRILQTLDVDSALKVAIRELGEALDSPETSVRLHVDEEMLSEEFVPGKNGVRQTGG